MKPQEPGQQLEHTSPSNSKDRSIARGIRWSGTGAALLAGLFLGQDYRRDGRNGPLVGLVPKIAGVQQLSVRNKRDLADLRTGTR